MEASKEVTEVTAVVTAADREVTAAETEETADNRADTAETEETVASKEVTEATAAVTAADREVTEPKPLPSHRPTTDRPATETASRNLRTATEMETETRNHRPPPAQPPVTAKRRLVS